VTRSTAEQGPHEPVGRDLMPPSDDGTSDPIAATSRHRSPRKIASVFILLVVAVGIGMAALRWTGELPYGSDNDEYRLVARSLLLGAGPLSAGEATKYPLGYPLLLAGIERLGLPLERTALTLNAILVFTIAALVAFNVSKTSSLLAWFSAAVFVVTSSELWSSVFSIMPDVLFVALVALMLTVLSARRSIRSAFVVVCVATLTFAMVMVRSAGLFMVVPAVLGLLTGPREQRKWAWLPAVVAIACLILSSALVASFPPHTTSYARFFWARDPFDQAKGTISASELPGRFVLQSASALREATGAVADEFAGSGLVASALLLAAVGLWREQRIITASLVVTQLCLLSLWPYFDVRLALPLLCIGTLGAAALVAVIERSRAKRWLAITLVGGLLGVRLYHEGERAARLASAEKSSLSELNKASGEVVQWMQLHSPANEGIASFDYREWALRLNMRVVPLGYTSDMSSLWAAIEAGRPQWFIASSRTFHKRKEYADRLLHLYAPHFTLAYSNSVFDVYQVALHR
jgi:hypothetical protein